MLAVVSARGFRYTLASNGLLQLSGHWGQRFNSHSASSKLFADALKEESEDVEKPRRPDPTLLNSDNWTGEESTHDAVLRMLIDKYKPLRSGTVRTAEQKIKATIPNIVTYNEQDPQPLLPPINHPDGVYHPWMASFKSPSHASTPAIRAGRFNTPLPQSPATLREDAKPEDAKAQRKMQRVARLHQAKETSLDYRLGRPVKAVTRANPVSLKGWASLVEERIENARRLGQFNNLTGHGTPLAARTEDTNPFIARDEHLLNRLVKRNGAAPLWVEIQGELDNSIRTFRQILETSWVRRAVRLLTNERAPQSLETLTESDMSALRDSGWETREESYHEAAVQDVNTIVRKYNAIAPYAVRRPYLSRRAELERCYNVSGDLIVRALQERAEAKNLEARTRVETPALGLWAALKGYFIRTFG